mmetsp:Transcript_78664/g.91974  ORF Transcript_78664/g.91974 Transcript_78664/m.91974 type:complete len:124 (+) Transcript_78664:26-397(+)
MDVQKSQKKIKPTSNVVQISSKRDAGFYVFLCKLFLMDFPEIELHGLGDAINTGVKVSETLTRFGYTAIKKIQTTTLGPETSETNDKDHKREVKKGKKAKLIVTLTKSGNFNKLIQNFKIEGK